MASANDLMNLLKTRLETARTAGLSISEILIEGQLPEMGQGAINVGISTAQDGAVVGLYEWYAARIEIQVGGVREGANNPEILIVAQHIKSIVTEWHEEQSVYQFTTGGYPQIASAVRAPTGFKTVISMTLQYQQEEAVY